MCLSWWWYQPVDATLYLKGEMECMVMGKGFHRGFTAAEKTDMGSLEARRVAEGVPTGNFTGNSAASGPFGPISKQETAVPQSLFEQIPTGNYQGKYLG
jgi:hypothetical protein